MAFSTCPIATIDAPAERVWSLVAEPSSYALWWGARTCSIEPEGPAVPGQRVHAQSAALGRQWNITVVVASVDETRYQIRLTTMLPLGITVHNHITCAPLDGKCHVTFG